MADEIVNGYRGVEDAWRFYNKTERLAMSGKSSRYLDGLLFASNKGGISTPQNER